MVGMQMHQTEPNASSHSPSGGWKNRAFAFYERHESKLGLIFFFGGFAFDAVMLPGIDEAKAYVQQGLYLFFVALILVYDFQWGQDATISFGPPILKRLWGYRGLAEHFFLGTLFNIYSLFFLKSASLYSSMIFVAALFASVVANELHAVKKSGVNTKVALFVVCLFCFFSVLVPMLLGSVGYLPFALSLGLTVGFLALLYLALRGKVGSIVLKRKLLWPGGAVIAIFTGLYIFGLIPPVPLSAVKMGIYHRVEKRNGSYLLYSERPKWEIWKAGDQDFRAEPGDKPWFFVSLFSPARFDDQVFLHWYWKDPRNGWKSTDRIPMHVSGGREGGYRGTTTKENFTGGDWKVAVETSDRREVGRLYFTVTPVAAGGPRDFREEEY